MKSPLHQLSIISGFGEVEICPQEKVGLLCGGVRLRGVGAPGGTVLTPEVGVAPCPLGLPSKDWPLLAL